MEQWGSSCNCHQAEWLAGVKYECAHRGRLLPYAHEYAQTQFASLIDEARQWDARYWGCMDFLRVCMGVVHSTVSRGNLKLAFVDRAPYIFANLGFKDGIRERAIEQFASAPLEKHNRNSIAICTPGTDLNDAMMAMTSFDDLSDPLLRRFVFRIRLAPLNDELGEGPHSQFSKEHSHANRATFSF